MSVTTGRFVRRLIGLAGLIAVTSVVSTAMSAQATQGQPVLAGQSNDADDLTALTNNCPDTGGSCSHSGLTVTANNSIGIGVVGYSQAEGLLGYGFAPGGVGVAGVGGKWGVYGTGWNGSGVGVFGESSNDDAIRAKAHTAGRSGLFATNDANGYGVYTTSGGVGLYADGSNGDAIESHAHTAGKSGLYATNDGGGYGVFAVGSGGSSSEGVLGTGQLNGVHGRSPSGNGVEGVSTGNGASGVYGQNDGTGYGVAGRAADGTALFGESTRGIALWTNGRVHFNRSGILTVQAGHSTVVRSNLTLYPTSFVLATMQNYRAGVYIAAAVPDWQHGRITIHLNKPVTAATKIAFFILN